MTSTRTTGVADLRAALTAARNADVVTAGAGAVVTLGFAYEATIHGATLSFALILALALFLVSVYAFLVVPHVAIALTIPIFALLPATKILVAPWLGPIKDVIALAAITAGAPLLALRHRFGSTRPVDRWLVATTLLLIVVYVINAGGGHGVAWGQGVRLVCEPLLLLLAGLGLDQPRRTLRWAMASLIATSCIVAVVGLIQQRLGQWRLVDLGYSFSVQVRTYHGHLRSFGTLDEPFAYAALLLLGLAAVIFAMRRTFLAYACAGLVLLGLAASYVRTAGLVVVALLALELARQRRIGTAVAIAALVFAIAIVVVIDASGTESRTYQGPSAALTLNGRTSAWKAALGTPSQWFIGQGVGAVGTAANRARYTLTQTAEQQRRNRTRAVDSGYFATIADVGLVGLLVLLALFGRAFAFGGRAAAKGDRAGWLALGLLLVLTVDALTRASFTGFPSAFLGMLLVGLALSVAAEDRPAAQWP